MQKFTGSLDEIRKMQAGRHQLSMKRTMRVCIVGHRAKTGDDLLPVIKIAMEKEYYTSDELG